MTRGFRIDFRHSAGNLHIRLSGEFNGMCAWELIKIIKRRYIGVGRIFINTAGLNRIVGDGVDLFKSYMSRKSIPPDWLYFKGEKGFKIAPDYCRVLICKKNRQPVKTPCPSPFENVRTLRSLK